MRPSPRKLAILIFVTLTLLNSACGSSAETPQTTAAPQTSSEPELILFFSERDGTQRLYTMTPDGQNVQLLDIPGLPANALIDLPVWYPTVNKYLTTVTTSIDSEIYIFDRDGSNLTNLSNSPGFFDSTATISPDGQYITFVTVEYDLDVMLMKIDGSGRTNLSVHAARDAHPVWAPDSMHIFFSSNRGGTPNIYTITRDGAEVSNVSQGSGQDGDFSISPDGKRVVFDSDRAGGLDIFVVDTNGENLANLTNNPSRDAEPLWSPDGAKIAFRSDRDSTWNIYIMNVDGSDVTQLTYGGEGNKLGMSWSPDGKYLLYTLNLDDRSDIYRIDIKSGQAVNLTDSPARDYGAIWIKY